MFERKPLRAHVHKEILARIVDGRLPAGTRINESRLSADLGLSRTPLREAMLGLEALGFLHSGMGHGFQVPPLDTAEFSEWQLVLGRLAPLALEVSPALSPQTVMELNNLLGRARLEGASGRKGGLELARFLQRWSALLLADCPRSRVAGEVARLEALGGRYWVAAVESGYDPSALLKEHRALYEALRKGDPGAPAAWAQMIDGRAAEVITRLPGESSGT